MELSIKSIYPFATALMLSLCGGFLFNLAGIPLPWMLGPLFAVGGAGVCGIKVADIRGSRQTGQLLIGCGLGLYFTTEVSRLILNFAGYVLAAAFAAILIGAFGGLLLKRIAGISSITAYFASVPGGAAEMAILAERAGARFDQVALCHSIRVLMVVSTIPFAVTFSGATGIETFTPPGTTATIHGFITLLLIAIGAGFIFMKAGVPNAWLLGPLAVSMALTISGQSLSAIPSLLAIVAQILIGCSLGVRFKPSLRSESRKLMIGVIASGLLTLFLSGVLGSMMAWVMGKSVPTMVLATAPGGLSEMCITAKILNLGVPLVTSFQVARLAIVVTFSLPTWRLLQAIRRKTETKQS